MKIYAGTTIAQPTASQLYFLVRELDKQGAGWLRLSIKYLCNFFCKSKDTILRWARNCFYFAESEVRGDRLFIKYRAIRKVKADSKVPAHASFEGSLDIIKDVKLLKAACYEAAMARQQEACQYQIQKLVNSSKKMFMPPSLEIMQSSKCAKGCEHYDKKTRRAFVKRHVIPVGASQSTVAKKVGRCLSTLAKHTKHIPRLHVWLRTYLRKASQEVPKYYYKVRISKVRRDGSTYSENRLYRRMPNYYFCNVDTKHEQTAEVYVVSDPCKALDERARLVQFVLAQMPKRRSRSGIQGDLSKPEVQAKFIERLKDLPKDRIYKLVCGFYMYASGVPDSASTQQSIIQQISSINLYDLIDKTANTLLLIKAERDERLMDYLKLLLRRAQKSCMVIPPFWETYRDKGYKLVV